VVAPKPDNIFLVREGYEDIAKVLDFGIARRLGDLGQSSGVQTQSGAIMGTPYYMSPEQATGKPVDHRSDIWSFAVIAFECLVGKRPFEAETWGGLKPFA
jgi:serine/threonine-protein kinase